MFDSRDYKGFRIRKKRLAAQKNSNLKKIIIAVSVIMVILLTVIVLKEKNTNHKMPPPQKKTPKPVSTNIVKPINTPRIENTLKTFPKGEFKPIASLIKKILKDKRESFNPQLLMIKEAILKTEKNFPGIAGIIFYDIPSKNIISIRPNEVFAAASLIKVPIMISAMHQIKIGNLNPDEVYTLKKEDFVGGGGFLKNQKLGTKYTYNELIEFMVSQSDNTATDLLINKIGMDVINKDLGGLGFKTTKVYRTIFDFEAIKDGNDNDTTPLEMMMFFKGLYEGSIYNKDISEKCISILKVQKYNDLIPRDLPKDIEIAHKTGELDAELHDTGIIYLKDHPYILCLLGKKITDMNNAAVSWGDLSFEIYKILSENTNQ